MKPLFDAIVNEINPPEGDLEAPLQILFTNIEYDEYLGRIGVGRVVRGQVKSGQSVALCHKDGTSNNLKIAKLFMYRGLKRYEEESAKVWDIIQVAVLANLESICRVGFLYTQTYIGHNLFKKAVTQIT